MRRMKRHRLAAIIVSICLYLIDNAIAEDNFEDADKLSEFISASTGQQFDLRHTIPGIPDVDYPIYSEVPNTSFECAGRHEGYYADIESRCQAFRICTHTARALSGFGFLCPNGTLFSQKHFVCDWYRNVNCDDSERFYNKNNANRIGSTLDMMETVRQMMEYPMKTISKALQQNSGSSRKPTQRHPDGIRAESQHNKSYGNSKELVEKNDSRTNSARKSVTRAQVESAHSRGNKKYYKKEEGSQSIVIQENSKAAEQNGNEAKFSAAEQPLKHAFDASSSNSEGNVYVNSLGELSTDPGVYFDRTNAHIIAEPKRYRYEKNMNFAARVNAALNELSEVPVDEKLAPDYVKQMRSTIEDEATQIDLASNINGLLDEVAYDLNPSLSGYQVQSPLKSKHSVRFLSRGFSSQEDPYNYKKPKQTASTIRFTPNQIPLDDEKKALKPTFEIADDAAGFGQFVTSTNTEETPLISGALDYLSPPLDSPAFEETAYLEPPMLPTVESENIMNTTDEPNEKAEEIITTTAENEVYTVTPSAVDLPVYAALANTTTETQNNLEAATTATPDIQNLVVKQKEQTSELKVNEDETAPIDEDRLDVNKQAEKLFLSGLKLTANENETEVTTLRTQTPLLIQVPEDHSYLTAWVTSTPPATTVTENASTTTTSTTTEAPVVTAETGSLQERIRNYRRLSSHQRATTKPIVYGKRAHSRMSSKLTTSASTTPKTTTTRRYLKRVAASRLRLSRLAAAAGNKTDNNLKPSSVASLPVHNTIDAGDNKKLSVRNIEKETAVVGNVLNDTDSSKAHGIVTWESVRKNLQRFQVGHKNILNDKIQQPSLSTTLTPTQISTAEEASTTARSSLIRSRKRFSTFKMSASPRNRKSTNQQAKAATTTSTSQSVSSASSSSSNSNSALPSNFLSLNTNTAIGSIVSNTPFEADNTNLNSNSASSLNSPKFLTFDKLAHSIVDDSTLQNYRSGQTLGKSLANPILASNAPQARFSSLSQATSYSTSALSSNTYQVNSHNAYNNQAFPAQPQRPAPLLAFQAPTSRPLITTTPGPRIVIARAEGQRIEPNSVPSLISSLITQQQQKTLPKATPATSYVPLDDFLTNKFGNQSPTKATQIASTYYQQPQHLQSRPLSGQQYQPQPQQQRQLQNSQSYLNQYRQQPNYQQNLTPAQPTLPTIYAPQSHQQPQQQFIFKQPPQLAPATPSLQPLPVKNIFANFQQQQQQLPQFPPLAPQAILQPPALPSTSSTQSFQNLSPKFNGNSNFLNIQLPTLTNGLIPAPNLLANAQKRSDPSIDNLQLTAYAPMRSVFSGATSYDVPLSSIGRLPNDIQALLRRLRTH